MKTPGLAPAFFFSSEDSMTKRNYMLLLIALMLPACKREEVQIAEKVARLEKEQEAIARSGKLSPCMVAQR
jgi:hypothetical protein